MESVTISITLEELLELPGEAVIRLLAKAAPSRAFLESAYQHENRALHGKGRWPVNNHLRAMLIKLPL